VSAAASGPRPTGALEIGTLNAAPAEAFSALLAPLFEGAPGFLGRLASAGPFASWDDLFRQARVIAHSLPEPLQVELVDAHPRLGAPPASVSAMSHREQGYDRDRAASAAASERAPRERGRIAAELEDLNAEYERRFGFRYCVFVAGRPRAELIPEMAAALGADRETELRRALDAVIDIARDRAVRSGTVSA
jgi:2-oxo-4-hydroxy-4-carboxy--5-ureidoimidazoline (OHCU) decarboxylase